jgi:zeaxanthin glucosyltransferase
MGGKTMKPQNIAFICDAGPSHVMAFGAIGRELLRRGHCVTVFQAGELEPKISAEGLAFAPLRSHDFSVEQYVDSVNDQQGVALRNFLDYATKSARMLCEEAPKALRERGVDGVVVDIAQPGGATAAELAGLPFVTVCNALPLHSEPDVPPDFLPWMYKDAWWARLRNRAAYAARDFMIRPLHRALNEYRRGAGLQKYRRPDDSFSPIAQITQLVREFDLPRRRLPEWFHYVGPYRREPEREVAFPYERLNGRPIIYASLGTVFGSRMEIWRAIIEGCSGIDSQLVIALGGRAHAEALDDAGAGTIVVDYAPQRELLRRASLAITHGGLNSVMEALAAAAPMLAIPITGDQFGVAARIRYTGAGEVVPARECTAARVRSAMRKVLSAPEYREREAPIGAAIGNTQGAEAAAGIIEEAIATRRPVTSQKMALC